MARLKSGHEITCTDASTASDADLARGLCLHWVCPLDCAKVVPLTAGLTIGRGNSCELRVDSGAVSRQHASFVQKQGLLHCIDLGSRNGTYVNGKLTRDAPVGLGDIVRCGEAVWVISRLRDGAGTPGIRQLAPGLYGGDTLAEALDPLRRIAPSTLSVILEGETGVGKELIARAVHTWSGRTGKYIAVNCAALPEALAEGELFGYRKGAFTGAERQHLGYFRAAQNGTLLLDEICELPLRLQAKLLRVLEEREVVPLGESEAVPLDVRVVAAAQRPLLVETRAGRFREDLYARLGATVRVPPLRERLEDVIALFRLFLEQSISRAPELQARFVEALLQYRFPKNVRELRQLADWVAMLHWEEPLLRRSHLPAWLLGTGTPPNAGASSESSPPRAGSTKPPMQRASVDEDGRERGEPDRVTSEKDLPRLLEALERHRGNVVRAAQSVGLSRHQAYRMLRSRPDVALEDFRKRPDESNDKLE